METEIIALPKATDIWDEGWMRALYDNCQSALKFEDNTLIISERYRHCLQRGKAAIIQNMMKLIIDIGYIKPQYNSSYYVLYWRDAPQWLATFVQHLETVFTRDKEIKIRRKILGHSVGMATSAAANVPLPRPSKDWKEDAIQILYTDCQCAVNLLESNSAIISENYRQCLQRGREAIIENIMEFVMDTGYFKKQFNSTEYVLFWKDAPQGFARFLQHLEIVFTGNEEVKIRRKRVAPAVVNVEIWALGKPSLYTLGLATSYDVLNYGLTYLYEDLTKKDRKEQQRLPAIASLVAFVEEPDPRLKSGVLKTYGEMKFFSVEFKVQLEFLQGKRLLNEKWAEEDESYKLSGETKVILCMHLWSLMKYAGFSKSEKIWEAISKGWPECVSWSGENHGVWWKIIHLEEVPLRIQAENKGLKTILDAYKDMERYFKGHNQHFLINWATAYYPEEDIPNPAVN